MPNRRKSQATRDPQRRPVAQRRASRIARLQRRRVLTGGSARGGGGALRYVLPAVVVAGLAYLLWPKDLFAKDRQPQPPVNPPNGGTNPRRYQPAPAGAGFSSAVVPHVLPGDPPEWNNGLLVHTGPSTQTPLIAPAGVGTVHADRGDELVLLEVNRPDESTPKTKRLWARVITLRGGRGWVSQVDPRDNQPNFTVAQAPQNVQGLVPGFVQPDIGTTPGEEHPVPAGSYPTLTANQLAAPQQAFGALPSFAAPAAPLFSDVRAQAAQAYPSAAFQPLNPMASSMPLGMGPGVGAFAPSDPGRRVSALAPYAAAQSARANHAIQQAALMARNFGPPPRRPVVSGWSAPPVWRR